MVFKLIIHIALAVFLGTGCLAKANVPDRPAFIARKATESILLDITYTGTGQRMVIVGDRGHILYSDDHGEQWLQASVPTQKMLTAVSFPSDDIGYAAGHDAIILKTTDGGTTWQKIYDDLKLGIPLLDIRFINNNRGIAVGAYGLALKTEDGGTTWQTFSTAIGNHDELHLNVISGSSDNLYLAGEQGILFHSGDFGKSWQSLKTGYNGSWFGLMAGGDQSLWLYGLRGTIYQSDNQGTAWSAAAPEVKQTLFGGDLLEDQYLEDQYPVLVGDAGIIVIKQQGRWFSWQLDQQKTLNAVLVTRDRHLMVVGEMGVKKIALKTIVSGVRP